MPFIPQFVPPFAIWATPAPERRFNALSNPSLTAHFGAAYWKPTKTGLERPDKAIRNSLRKESGLEA